MAHHIYFIRSATLDDPATCFESRTDVWVLGDVVGFQYVRDQIRTARGTSKPLRLNAIPNESPSMRVTILPASAAPRLQPRVKLLERLIPHRGEPWMELVIYGNSPGYEELTAVFDRAIADPGDPSDHEHVDDAPCRGRFVVPRSVSLNVRRPLRQWRIEELLGYAECVTSRNPRFFLPREISPEFLTLYTPKQYTPADVRFDPHFRLH